MARMNSRFLVSYFNPATAIGQCSKTGSSGIISNVTVGLDVSGLMGLSPTCILFEKDVAHSAPLTPFWFPCLSRLSNSIANLFLCRGGSEHNVVMMLSFQNSFGRDVAHSAPLPWFLCLHVCRLSNLIAIYYLAKENQNIASQWCYPFQNSFERDVAYSAPPLVPVSMKAIELNRKFISLRGDQNIMSQWCYPFQNSVEMPPYSIMKVCRYMVLTYWWVSQLIADHTGIYVVPVIITHCSPLIGKAHLHSSFLNAASSH